MKSIAIQGSKRGDVGKKATKTARREGQVPCVIYGGKENVHFSAPKLSFRDIVYTGDFKLAEIEVEGSKHKCILKNVDFHPVTDEILHIDFLELSEGRPFKVNLPVRFKGVAPGVKSGGALMPKLRKIQVKTTLDALIDEVLVDVSSLELGSSIRVRDIELSEGIEILNAEGIPIASVEIPRALRSIEDEAAEAEEGAEGEGAEGEGAAEGAEAPPAKE